MTKAEKLNTRSSDMGSLAAIHLAVVLLALPGFLASFSSALPL
jgi:hypothetical protein